jgi:stringent starvation protein B
MWKLENPIPDFAPMNEILNREKFREIDRLLEDEYIMLQIDPSCSGVDIPDHLRDSPSVTLQISRLFRGSMEVTEKKIEAHLLFSGSYYCCVVPFEAIWAAVSAEGEEKLWPSSIPEAVAKQLTAAHKKNAATTDSPFPATTDSETKKGGLEARKGAAATDENDTKPKKKGRPQLKLVKG